MSVWPLANDSSVAWRGFHASPDPSQCCPSEPSPNGAPPRRSGGCEHRVWLWARVWVQEGGGRHGRGRDSTGTVRPCFGSHDRQPCPIPRSPLTRARPRSSVSRWDRSGDSHVSWLQAGPKASGPQLP